MTWVREKIKIPTSIKPKDRVKISEVLINHIINRSAAGLDKNNKKFPKYTKEYAEIKGVGVTDVDLIMEGELLESIILLNHKAGEITIGFDKSDEELNGKAEGNILGSYGRDPNPKKARDFLGVSSDELEILIDSYKEESAASPLTDDELDSLVSQLSDELLGDI